MTAALIIIDTQQGLDDPKYGRRSTPEAEANIARLLAAWRRREQPIVHIRHCSARPDSPLRPELPGNAFKPEAQPLPGETEFTKTTNSAFMGTGLEQYLRDRAINDLVIAGLTTDHCVSATTRMASDLGFNVIVAADATAAHEQVGFDGVHYSAETIHRVNLVSLDGEFCVVQATDEIVRGLG